MMNLNSDNMSKLSGRPQRSYIHSDFGGITPPVPHQTPGYGVQTSNAEDKWCLEDYFEVMSPGFEIWGAESGGASAGSSLIKSNKGMATCEIPSPSLQLANLQNLPYKKRPFTGLDVVDLGITRGTRLKMSSITASSSQHVDDRNDCARAASYILNESNRRRMSVFKHKLVERIKLLLHPDWKNGGLSKEAYKDIVRKTSTKVVETISYAKIPDTSEKIDKYLAVSEKKILNVIQQYVKKQLCKSKCSEPGYS